MALGLARVLKVRLTCAESVGYGGEPDIRGSTEVSSILAFGGPGDQREP
jgi:hypothetical protein